MKWIEYSKTRNSVIFLCVFLLVFALISLINLTRKQPAEKAYKLTRFQSDFKELDSKVYEQHQLKKNRFIAYGNYVTLHPGKYRTLFTFKEEPAAQGTYRLQIASGKGKSIEIEKLIEIERDDQNFSLKFRIARQKEVEPRILYIEGNRNISVASIKLVKTGNIFPLPRILYLSFLIAVFSVLLIISFIHIIQNSRKWRFYLVAFLLVFTFFSIVSQAWVSEDAFITLRHVENFMSANGPVFNAAERVEGFSHVLWFYIISFFRAVGFNPKSSVIIPAFLFSFLSLYLVLFKLKFEKSKEIPISFGIALMLGVRAFIDFGTSGLETSLFYFLIIWFALLAAENYWITRPLLTGLVTALLVLTRPDFIVFGVVLFLFYAYEWIGRRIKLNSVMKFLLFPAILLTVYEIFRMGYYASLLPNPFYTKSGGQSHFSQGIQYLLDFFEGSVFLVILLLAVVTLAVRLKKPDFKNRLIVFLCGFTHGFFVIRGGGDFMHGRFLLPALILISVSTIGIFNDFFEKNRLLKTAGFVLVLGLFFISFARVPVQKKGVVFNRGGISDERYAYYKNRPTRIRDMFQDNTIMMWKTMGRNYQKLSRRSGMRIKIAYKNVGFLGFYAGENVYVLDRLGLTDPVVSRIKIFERARPGHEKHAPLAYLIYRKITFGKTPFVLWNKLAETRFGTLWDLSPKSLEKLSGFLPDGFKNRLDKGIKEFLMTADWKNSDSHIEFMYFLRNIWYPFAPDEHQQLFDKTYDEDFISRNSHNYQWLEDNREKIAILDSHLRGPLTFGRFLKNLRFAVLGSDLEL